MTGWDWCKQVFDPEVVGYYRVDGNNVAFTTKAGEHHDLQVDDFADVEHGKALVSAKIAGKVPPVKEVVELPTLEEALGYYADVTIANQKKQAEGFPDITFPTPEWADEPVVELAPKTPKKPPRKKALPK